jgi:phenylpropionate dioxygenase-like ring-hydroxylating dioxygenase large terminal subunit
MIALDTLPTGWFHIGWSAEIAPGEVKPMTYFGEELVAFRSEDGRLAVLDAHCHHLGAHLGYGGKVKGDCVACPYHGWEWDLEGANARIPYQDRPVNKRLRKWPTLERHGLIFAWCDPAGGPPRWDLPDLFKDFEGLEPVAEDSFYPCYPQAVVDKPGEPFPAQFMMENAADTTHFKFTHGTPEYPQLLEFHERGAWWTDTMGFISPKTKQVAMTLHQIMPNIGLSFTMFNGPGAYRLILSGTPVDQKTSHMRVSYFLPRVSESWDVMPDKLAAFAASTDELYEEDARIWRHQRFQQRPVFAAQDVAGYTSYRRWSEKFYEADRVESPAALMG